MFLYTEHIFSNSVVIKYVLVLIQVDKPKCPEAEDDHHGFTSFSSKVVFLLSFAFSLFCSYLPTLKFLALSPVTEHLLFFLFLCLYYGKYFRDDYKVFYINNSLQK